MNNDDLFLVIHDGKAADTPPTRPRLQLSYNFAPRKIRRSVYMLAIQIRTNSLSAAQQIVAGCLKPAPGAVPTSSLLRVLECVPSLEIRCSLTR